jgi:hypothetical protein
MEISSTLNTSQTILIQFTTLMEQAYTKENSKYLGTLFLNIPIQNATTQFIL